MCVSRAAADTAAAVAERANPEAAEGGALVLPSTNASIDFVSRRPRFGPLQGGGN